MSLRRKSYVVPKPPKGGSKTQSVRNFNNKLRCDNSETVRYRCQLLLITNRKSHTGFRLVPTSMSLNDFERRNSLYFAFFSPNSADFQADYITVVKDRPISVKYCLPVPVFHFWRKLYYYCWLTLTVILCFQIKNL